MAHVMAGLVLDARRHERRKNSLFVRKSSLFWRKHLPVPRNQSPCFSDRGGGRRATSAPVRIASAPARRAAGAASVAPLAGAKILGENDALCYICSPLERRPMTGLLRALSPAAHALGLAAHLRPSAGGRER